MYTLCYFLFCTGKQLQLNVTCIVYQPAYNSVHVNLQWESAPPNLMKSKVPQYKLVRNMTLTNGT